ncbi:MAG: hypothetical protein AAFV95_22420 [Bacteroidota bacterium]
MKNIIGLFAILVAGYFVHQWLPWWSIAIVCAIVCAWLQQTAWKNFLLGFVGVALLWGLTAFVINQGNDSILAARMGELLGGLSGGLLVGVTALLGGLVGGFGGMSGGLAGQLGQGSPEAA